MTKLVSTNQKTHQLKHTRRNYQVSFLHFGPHSHAIYLYILNLEVIVSVTLTLGVAKRSELTLAWPRRNPRCFNSFL